MKQRTFFFSCYGNTDTLKLMIMCSVDFQLFVKKVMRGSRYFNWNKHGRVEGTNMGAACF